MDQSEAQPIHVRVGPCCCSSNSCCIEARSAAAWYFLKKNENRFLGFYWLDRCTVWKIQDSYWEKIPVLEVVFFRRLSPSTIALYHTTRYICTEYFILLPSHVHVRMTHVWYVYTPYLVCYPTGETKNTTHPGPTRMYRSITPHKGTVRIPSDKFSKSFLCP